MHPRVNNPCLSLSLASPSCSSAVCFRATIVSNLSQSTIGTGHKLARFKRNMYVFRKLIVALLLTTVGLPFAVQIEANRGTNSAGLIAGQSPQFSAAFENDTQLPDKREGATSAKIVKRDASNGDSSKT